MGTYLSAEERLCKDCNNVIKDAFSSLCETCYFNLSMQIENTIMKDTGYIFYCEQHQAVNGMIMRSCRYCSEYKLDARSDRKYCDECLS